MTALRYRFAAVPLLLLALLAVAPGASAYEFSDGTGGGNGQGSSALSFSPAVLACMRKVLTPAQLRTARSHPDALTGAARRKALACYNSGGVANAHIAKTGAWIVANPVDLAHGRHPELRREGRRVDAQRVVPGGHERRRHPREAYGSPLPLPFRRTRFRN